MITANQVRRIINPSYDAGFWVRKFKDGQVWVGPNHGSIQNQALLVSILTKNGYQCKCTGKPGTAGQFIIEIAKTK